MASGADVVTLYGLKNCDSCRRARKWLAENDVEFSFHDVREDGLNEERLRAWGTRVEWSRLLNTKSRTWRELNPADKTDLNAERAERLMVQHPTLVKRPVLERGKALLIGFSAEDYANTLLS